MHPPDALFLIKYRRTRFLWPTANFFPKCSTPAVCQWWTFLCVFRHSPFFSRVFHAAFLPRTRCPPRPLQGCRLNSCLCCSPVWNPIVASGVFSASRLHPAERRLGGLTPLHSEPVPGFSSSYSHLCRATESWAFQASPGKLAPLLLPPWAGTRLGSSSSQPGSFSISSVFQKWVETSDTFFSPAVFLGLHYHCHFDSIWRSACLVTAESKVKLRISHEWWLWVHLGYLVVLMSPPIDIVLTFLDFFLSVCTSEHLLY